MTIGSWIENEEGQTMTEYSLVVAVLVLGVIAAIGFFGVAAAGHIDSVVTGIGGLVG